MVGVRGLAWGYRQPVGACLCWGCRRLGLGQWEENQWIFCRSISGFGREVFSLLLFAGYKGGLLGGCEMLESHLGHQEAVKGVVW